MSDEDGTGSNGVGAADSSAPTLCGFDTPVLLDWVLFHVPHDSTFIPPSERSKLLLNDTQLNAELRGSGTDNQSCQLERDCG